MNPLRLATLDASPFCCAKGGRIYCGFGFFAFVAFSAHNFGGAIVLLDFGIHGFLGACPRFPTLIHPTIGIAVVV